MPIAFNHGPMCGIAGIIDYNPHEDYKNLLGKMVGVISYRGPDAFGIYTDRSAGLASTRLSIIDLNTGDQPIHNEDKSVWVVLNGEIFNYPELRQDLEVKGHNFYTQTDTEVLVHLYEEHGPEFLDLLNGQFAFAIWDHKKETLLLGRDRVGIHPLFYYMSNARLVFGSEIKTIFMDEKIPRRLNMQTLSDIFTCWTPVSPNTSFDGIFQIPPGHFAVFSRKGIKIQKYWELPFTKAGTVEEKQLFELVEELKELLYDSTRIRLRADVPVGAYLSGGLDSTYITSVVKNNFNNQLRTFSVSFSDGRFDEAPFQEKAVKALNTDHRTIQCSEEDIGTLFQDVIWHAEVPLLRTGPAPLFQLSRLVRNNNFKVVLTGEGADEFFAGYNIFREDRVRRFWARNPDSNIRPGLLKKLYPYIFTDNGGKTNPFLKSFFKRHLTEIESPVYSHVLRWENTVNLKGFFSDDMMESMPLKDFIDKYISSLPPDFMSWDSVSKAQYTEITMFLSNYLLSSQGDRMAMGNSVEGRFPYLDHRVMEFACRVPPRYRIKGLTEKFILKQVAKDDIPFELVERPKQPYRAPITKCFVGPTSPDYTKELLSDTAITDKGYFDSKKVSELLKKCSRRQGNILSERENMALVGILSTQLLDHQFIKNFPFGSVKIPANIRIFKQE